MGEGELNWVLSILSESKVFKFNFFTSLLNEALLLVCKIFKKSRSTDFFLSTKKNMSNNDKLFIIYIKILADEYESTNINDCAEREA